MGWPYDSASGEIPGEMVGYLEGGLLTNPRGAIGSSNPDQGVVLEIDLEECLLCLSKCDSGTLSLKFRECCEIVLEGFCVLVVGSPWWWEVLGGGKSLVVGSPWW
jgi:hypothetical protein